MRTIGAALVLGVLLAGMGAAVAATQQEVEEALTCQCGCGLTVHSCNHLQCPSGEPIKKEITERLARGEDKDTILGAFRQRYGEKVLSAPTFRGFNWFAWLTPFAAVFAGAAVLTVVLVRRSRRPVAVVTAGSTAPAGTDAQRARLAHELEEIDRS